MTSQIDTTKPVYGTPTTQSVRDNFATAATEITDLQARTTGSPFLPVSGGHMTGPMYLFNDPTDAMMPATKGYVDAAGGSGGGGTGLPEAPTDGKLYGRGQGAWQPTLPIAGGTMTGLLTLSGPPTAALHAATKAYVDASGGPTAVQRAGDTMTGLLVLAGDPSSVLGATTKQYVDAGIASRAPIDAPSFTGIVNANGGRVIVTSANAPSLTLNNTTFNSPVFGVFNAGNQFQIGLAIAGTGNLNGSPLAAMDQSGNFGFVGRVSALSGRLISTSGNLPSVTLNNTAGGARCWGLWSAVNGTLGIGLVDPAGTPTTSPLASFGSDGGLTFNGGLRSVAGSVALGPGAGSTNDVVLSSAAGPTFGIGTSYGSGQLAEVDMWANKVRVVNGFLVVDQYVNIGGVAYLATASGNTLNISNPSGGNLSGIGFFTTQITITGVQGVQANQLWGGAGGAGNLRLHSSGSLVNFHWSNNQLFYRIDESVEKQMCTALNAQTLNLVSGSGGPTTISLNINDNAGSLYGIFVDATSDAVVKTNIVDSELDALALIRRLRLRTFDYLPEIAGDADPHVDLGLVAQEVAEVIPAMVPDVPFDDGLARINLKAGVPYLIRAVQQIADRLAALEKRKR